MERVTAAVPMVVDIIDPNWIFVQRAEKWEKYRRKLLLFLLNQTKSTNPFDKQKTRRYNEQKSSKGERIVKKFASVMMNMMEMCMCPMCMRRRAYFPMCFLMN